MTLPATDSRLKPFLTVFHNFSSHPKISTLEPPAKAEGQGAVERTPGSGKGKDVRFHIFLRLWSVSTSNLEDRTSKVRPDEPLFNPCFLFVANMLRSENKRVSQTFLCLRPSGLRCLLMSLVFCSVWL